ncbi:putative reverse transcriptase domain-containing protein [Tanacetum coccineum]
MLLVIPLPQAPIAPPSVLPPSSVLPLFDPQDFFLPEEILPPQKRARFSYHPPLLISLPTSDELPLERIEHMEDKIKGLGNGRMAPKRTSTSAAPTMTQGRHQKLVADSVAAALEAQAATMELAVLMPNYGAILRNNGSLIGDYPEAFKGNDLALLSVRLATRERTLLKPVPKGKQQCPWKSILAKGQERSPRPERRADKSFISISLASMLNIPPITLDTTYHIEMADGNLLGTNTVIQGCTLILLNQPFKIDLMPIKIGSFDVVIGIDWLSKYHARIICDEKVVHIPIDGETLIIRELRPEDYSQTAFRMQIWTLRIQVMPFGLTNAPTVFMDLMNRVCKQYLDKFMIVFIDDLVIYSRKKEEHADHLRIILELLRKEELYAKFSKCDFWISIMQFLGHVIDSQGIYVDPQDIEHVFSILDQKELNMRQRRWLELLADYDCEIRYHPGKENVVADALAGIERIKPLQARSLVITLHPKLPSQILEAQTEAIKEENIKAENLRGMDNSI